MPSKKTRLLVQINSQGFTVIEILVAFFIIVVIAAILLTSGGGLFTSRTQKLQEIAGRIASKDIENLRKISFTDVAALPASQALTDSDLAKLPSSTATRTISDFAPPDTTVKRVTITIQWTDKITKTYTTDTLIYQNGL